MKFGKQETRTWATDYRGLVLICSSFQPYGDRELIEICGPEQYARILQVLGTKWFNVVKRGSAICIGRLINCQPFPEFWGNNSIQTKENRTFVKYDPAKFVHVYTDVRPVEHFPWKGAQGWKKLTPEEKLKIKLL